jgi:hypothetical protein
VSRAFEKVIAKVQTREAERKLFLLLK